MIRPPDRLLQFRLKFLILDEHFSAVQYLGRRAGTSRRCTHASKIKKPPFALPADGGSCMQRIAYMIWVPIHHATADMNAAAGMVRNQAHTMLPATPQRTADIFCAEPTPTIAPVMVWVVDTGTPR
jgi:hypothetical protein